MFITKITGKLNALLSGRSFVRSVAVIAGGTAMGQAIVVAASPILTRLYSPEDFGTLSVFVSLFSLLLVINSLRYELAIPLADDDEDAANTLALVVLLVIATTVIFGIGFWFLGDSIVNWVHAPALKPYLWLILVSLLAGGLYQGLSYWAIRKQAFNPLATSKLWQGFGLVVTQLAFGVLRLGTPGLLFGITMGQVTSNPALAWRVWRDDHMTLKKISFQGVIAMARRFRRFPLFTSWASFLNTAGLQLPAIFVVSIYGEQIGGWFALGQRMIGLPMALVGVSVGQVYISRASQVVQEDSTGLQNLYTKTVWRLLGIGILPIAILALTGPWLFALVFGEEWRTAGEYIRIMAPMFLAQFVVSSVSQNIYVIERQDIQSLWDVFRLVILLLTFGVASWFKFEPMAAVGIYSIGMFAAYILLFFLNRRALKQYQDNRAQS